jgi:predicted protein tyrosine phosphatase
MNILFVCSRNQWRSPTAEAVYRDDPRISVRSRGTSKAAVQNLRADDIRWADAILVMENQHRKRIIVDFSNEARDKPIHVLDIPDEYRLMDPELVNLLRAAADAIIDAICDTED